MGKWGYCWLPSITVKGSSFRKMMTKILSTYSRFEVDENSSRNIMLVICLIKENVFTITLPSIGRPVFEVTLGGDTMFGTKFLPKLPTHVNNGTNRWWYMERSRKITHLRPNYTGKYQHYHRTGELQIRTLITSLPSLHYRWLAILFPFWIALWLTCNEIISLPILSNTYPESLSIWYNDADLSRILILPGLRKVGAWREVLNRSWGHTVRMAVSRWVNVQPVNWYW